MSHNCSYFRTEILAGFVNGLFLFFVAFFIFAEAVEVKFLSLFQFIVIFVAISDHLNLLLVKHDRLMIISVAGFAVNLIGIFVFHHGRGNIACSIYQ